MSGERARLAAIALGAILAPLNSTMIVIALPRLMEDFGESLAAATWLVTTYLVAMAVLQPLAGRLGDRVGRRPLMLAGFVWFGLASVGAAASGSLELLIAFRVQQAAAAALVFPNAMALLRELGPPERLGSRLGTVSAVVPLSAAAGPPLAGVLLALFDWQALFLVNIPVVAIALVLALRSIPRGALHRERADGTRARRGRSPRMRPAPGFLVATAAIALSNLALYMTLLTLPLLLARRGGWSSEEVGLLLATFSLAAFALSPYGGRLADRAGRRLPAASGLALMAAGLVGLALAPGSIGAVALSAAMLVMGVGMGLSTPALQASALETVAMSASGAASGVTATSRYVGSIAGTLLVAGPLAPAAAGTGGFALIFAVLAGAAAAGLALALALPGRAVAAGTPGTALGQPNFG